MFKHLLTAQLNTTQEAAAVVVTQVFQQEVQAVLAVAVMAALVPTEVQMAQRTLEEVQVELGVVLLLELTAAQEL